MTCVDSLIFLGFIVCCLPAGEGRIISPAEGTSVTFLPGSTGNLTWIFDDDVSTLIIRAWYFTHRGGSKTELLGTISRNRDPDPEKSSLSGVEIKSPATLLLKNVNQSYNGEYQFQVTVSVGGIITPVDIIVFIARIPTVTLNCSSSITLNEGDDITCECRGVGGNPPADVTWYKDGVQTGGTKKENNTLTLKNVDETDSGIYTCLARSYPDPEYEDNETVVVRVNFKPKKTSIKFSQNPVRLGDSVTIKCESRGFPGPNYTITLNGTIPVSAEKMYNISEVKWNDTGTYNCTATNTLGNDLGSGFLDVIVTAGRTTQQPTANSPSNPMRNSTTPSGKVNRGSATIPGEPKNGGINWWFIVIMSLLGVVIIGILLSYTVWRSCRKFRSSKHQSNPEPQTTGVDPTYQGLDLNKMNKEDNYQSLTGNYAASNDVGTEDESAYTELNKIRDVEDQYQSLQ